MIEFLSHSGDVCDFTRAPTFGRRANGVAVDAETGKQVGLPNKYRNNSHDHTIRDLLCPLCPLCLVLYLPFNHGFWLESLWYDMCPLCCNVPTPESWQLRLQQLAMHIKSSSHLLIFPTFQHHRQWLALNLLLPRKPPISGNKNMKPCKPRQLSRKHSRRGD